jgi:CBS domain-containing protein
MAAIFAGASHALLASVVFAFETTRQPLGLLPLLGGCSAAYLISLLMMRTSIMTERLERRGTPARTEYSIDFLTQLLVRDVASRAVVSLGAEQPLAEVRAWLAAAGGETGGAAAHQGFPVLDARGRLEGVVTRRDLLDPARADTETVAALIRRAPVVIYEDNTLREAADQMVRERIGRLPVVHREAPLVITGILTRSDLLAAHRRRLDAEQHVDAVLRRRPGTYARARRRRLRRAKRRVR